MANSRRGAQPEGRLLIKSETTSRHWLRHNWPLWIGMALSALCLFLAVRKISLAALQEAMSTANWQWVALAMGVHTAGISLKAVRWRALFLPLQVWW